MQCPSCGFDNPEGMKFCGECAAPLENRCPQCGFESPQRFKFCGECATPLKGPFPTRQPRAEATDPQSPLSYTPPHLAERILAEKEAFEDRASPEGERKTITALFADIKGSMELIEELDPEEARSIIDPALKLMMDAVHRYDGYVAQSTGDGIFALFGAPIAHEDHPQRALYSALLMQEESRKFAETLRLEKGVNLRVRVGVNTGEVVVRSIRKDDLHTDYVPIGHSTSLGARLESLADPGSVLVSEHTQKLTEGYFQFKPLGATKIKGVSEPVDIYEVMGVGPFRTRLQVAARRGLVRFVGRRGEMEQMKRALELSKEGHGQIAAVMGEAGVGKSRLCYEFKLVSQSGCLVLETFSISHGKAYPYLPLIDLLKNYFEITAEDDDRRRREKVGGKVLMLDRALEDALPYIFTLLGISEPESSLQQMDPQIRRHRTFEAIKRLLLRESLNQPLFVMFEDLHWLDGETQAFLDILSESVATARLLLLVNYRPEYQHNWGSKTYYTQLRLDPLGAEEAGELLTALLGDGNGLQPLKQLIMEKTEGNPFFMEEVVQNLAEEEVLAGERGSYRLDKAPDKLHIPTTVQGVLTSRIDRLGAEEKELLQTLSAIGKEFSLGLLKKVVDQPEEELQRLLPRLQMAEYIYEQPAFPEPEYTFKHALTQEVAYNSLLIERRRILHERTARAIEVLYQNQIDDHYGELAHHYTRSGNTEKAVEYLHLAGQQAIQRSAYSEAISHLTRGLELIKTLPEVPERIHQELMLQIALGQALMITKGLAEPEAERVYARARELCKQVGDTPLLFPVLAGLRLFYHTRGELRTACELADQLLNMAQNAQDPALIVEAHRSLGSSLLFLGEFTSAREHLEQGLAFYDPRQDRALPGVQDPGIVCLCFVAWALWTLGYPDQAVERGREALNLARELSHPTSMAFALFQSAVLPLLRREAQLAQERAEEVITLSNEYGMTLWLAFGSMLRGSALAEQGQVEEGIVQIQQGRDAWRATGAELSLTQQIALLAEAYGKEGQTEEGLTALSEALVLVDKNGERYYEAEINRLKGELLLTQSEGNQTEPEDCFNKALEVARSQQAKSWELRAAMSLSRLRQRQGKREEARDLLAPVYDWFTEGFDTADLKEAKALLEELS